MMIRENRNLDFSVLICVPCPNLRAASAQRYSRAKSAPRVASARAPFPLLRRKPPLAPTHAENQGRICARKNSSAPYSPCGKIGLTYLPTCAPYFRKWVSLGFADRRVGERFRPRHILNFIFVVVRLAIGGGISYKTHRFAHKWVKQSDL